MRNWSKRLLAGLAKRAGTPENADAWAVAEEIRKWEVDGLADKWEALPPRDRAAACDYVNYLIDKGHKPMEGTYRVLDILQDMLRNAAKRADLEVEGEYG